MNNYHSNHEQQLLTLLKHISLAVAEEETIDKAYTAVLEQICRFMDWPLGHVYVWSSSAKALVSSHIWFMADASTIAPFRKLSEATQFKPGEGTLGRVWASGKAIMILDVQDEDIFVREMPVEEGGIQAYFAFPVVMENKVVAVLEFFSPKSEAPDHDMTSIINHVSALLALAIQRQKTVNQLRRSESMLAEAQRTARVGHWQWDIEKDEVFWSAELYRIFGINPATWEANYEEYVQLIHPEDADYARKMVTEAIDFGRPFDYFHRLVRPDGTIRVAHAQGRPVYNKAGKIIRLYGTSQDVTEQKETEEKLARSVRRLSALTEIGQDVSATLDLNLIYERVLGLVRPLINADLIMIILPNKDKLEIFAINPENSYGLDGMQFPADTGIVGEVWQTEKSVFITGDECVKRRPAHIVEQIGYEAMAVLAVPIRWQDKSVGVLEATHTRADAFEEEDLHLLEAVAAWTAIAIGNARQYKLLQRRLHESDALLDISNALIETLDRDEILQRIVDHVHKIIPNAEWTTIHLLNPKSKQLELAASAGLNTNNPLNRLGEGFSDRIMDKGYVSNSATALLDLKGRPVEHVSQSPSILAVPIEVLHRRFGIISVQCEMPGSFSEEDERLLTILGIQAGMAIENSRLYTVEQTARKKAEKQRERMRHMAQRVVQAQEQERARIARELHDESGQSLTSLKISLELIRAMLPPGLDEIREGMADIMELTDKTMNNLRLVSHNLRPPGLDVYGLDAALAGLCQDFKLHTQIDILYKDCDVPDLASLTALSLYRVAQEGLTNAVKHGEATEIRVILDHDSDWIRLVIKDNGRGFSPPDMNESISPVGAGLIGMVERLEMVDGFLEIQSSPGNGSRLTANVPYNKEEQKEEVLSII